MTVAPNTSSRTALDSFALAGLGGFQLRCLLIVAMAAMLLFPATGALAATGVCDTASNIDVESTGGTSPVGYSTLGDAFTAINAGTHTGTIVIEVCGDTTEPASTVLNASGSGSASYSSILVQPVGAAARTIAGAVTGNLIDLNGADNVTVDGLNSGGNALTIDNSNTGTSASTIRFIADATGNTVTNCTIKGAGTSATLGTIVFAAGTASGNNTNTITGNTITLSGASLPTNAIYSAGLSTGVPNSGISITNNLIQDYFNAAAASNGILVASNSAAWTITGNSFFQTVTRTATAANSYRAINIITSSGGGYTINSNTIGYSAANATGTTVYTSTSAIRFFAIEMTVAASPVSDVQGNTVTALSLTSSSGASTAPGIFTGISILGGSVNVGTTTGNTIGATTGNGSILVTSTTSGGYIGGIYSTSTGTVGIQNNNIGSISTGGTSTIGYLIRGIDTTGTAGSFTVSSNTIGSTTTANSIASGTSGTTTASTTFTGINNTATGAISISGNTIQNCSSFGTGSSAWNGVVNTGGTGTLTITGNNLISGTNAGTGLFLNISNSAGVATANINSNILRSHTITSTSGAFTGITSTGAVTTALNVNSNQLGNATGGLVTYTAANSGTLTGILTSGTTAAAVSISSNDYRGITYNLASSGSNTYLSLSNTSSATATINNNTWTNLNVNTTGSVTFITRSGSMTATGVENCNNNSIVTAFNKGGAGGTVTIYTANTSSVTGSAMTQTGNNFSNITVTGATTITGWSNTEGSSSTSGPIKTITGNTFSNIAGGTSSITMMSINFSGNGTNVSTNTISNVTGQSTITGLSIGSSNGGAAQSYSSNTITGLVSSGTGGTVTGITGGSSSVTTMTVANNIINTLSTTGSSSSVIGLTLTAASTANVTNNFINTLSGSGTSSPVATGLSVTSGTTVNVLKNKIYDISQSGAITTTSPAINGLLFSGGTTVNASNNLVGDLRTAAAGLTDAIRGISVTSTTSLTTFNISYNTVFIAATSSGTNFGTTGVFHTTSSTSTTATLNLRNNSVVNGSTPNGSGLAVAFRRSSGSASQLANYGSASNNNNFWAGTPGATNLIYSDGTSTAQTISAYKSGVFGAGTIAPRDSASISTNPAFLSTLGSSANFLHMDPAFQTQIESGGINVAGIADDYDGTIRQGNGGYTGTGSAPDIGADEFEGIPQDLTPPAINYTPLGNGVVAGTRNFTGVIVTDGTGVNTTAGTRPRAYFKRSTDTNAFNDNTNGTAGWKYSEATGTGGSPFMFTIDYSLLSGGGGVSIGDTVQYFVVAQDTVTPTPNVGINSGTFAMTPTSVALTAAEFPIGGSINSYIIGASLSGGKTVCASGCDYTSLTNAAGVFADINAKVITGNLSIQIAGDLTVETGANALNAFIEEPPLSGFTVTIFPTGSARVVSGSSTAGLIKLNGADRVTINGSIDAAGTDRSLTITNTSGGTSSAVVWLASASVSDGATNDAVRNTIISGTASTATFAGIFSGGTTTIGTAGNALTANSSNTVSNNQITKVQYGVLMVGTSTTNLDLGNVVSGNNVGTVTTGDGSSVAGVDLRLQNTATISGNDVQNIVGSGSVNMQGINLQDSKSSTVSANKVHFMSYTGVSTTKVYGITTSTSTFNIVGNPSANTYVNNAVYDLISAGVSASWNTSGINNNGGYGDKYYFNSVYLTGQMSTASGPSAAFSNGNGITSANASNIDVRDNIFHMKGSSTSTPILYAHYTTLSTYAGSTLNYNDLVSSASGSATAQIGFFASLARLNLAAWQSATGLEANSLSVDPLFNSNTNLQIQLGSPMLGAGTPIGGVTTDILGVTRNVTTPTVGAYETAVDLSGPVISYTPFGNTSLTTNRTLANTITDASGVPTAGTGRPVIYYRKNNTGSYVSNTCVFVSGSSYNCQINNTLIGGVTLGDSVQYYVVAQDNLSNVSANPSAGAGGFTANPPAASTPPTTPNSYTIVTALSGTRTVCATGCNYTTLTGAGGAFAAVNASVLDGNLILEIAGDLIVGEDGSVALNAISEQPTGSNFTVRINPTGIARTITSTTAPTGGFIRLNAADRVTINGALNNVGTNRSLTINDANIGTTSAVIWLQSNGIDGATSNTIKNLNIAGNANTTTLIGIGMGGDGTTAVSASSLGTNNNSNVIQNNNISKVQYGIYSQGASSALKNTGNSIFQNVINTASPNQVSKGILVGFENAITISQNNISNLSGSLTSYAYAISLGLTSTTTTTTTGNEVTNATVTRNTIGSVRASDTFGVAGIMIASATSGTTLIANNVIYDANTNGTFSDIGAGIYLGGGTGSTTNVYYNSVTMAGTFTGGLYPSFAIAINGSNPVVDLRDNILASTGSTGANLNRAIGLAYSTFTNLTSNYNDLFVSGTGSAVGQTGTLSNTGFTASTTLANWQTNTAKDANSLSVDPLFNSPTNLQPQTGSPVIAAGTPVAGVTNDILGVTRSVTTPSIGAYETSADTAPPIIGYTPLGNTTSTANRMLSITVMDASGVPTSGIGLPVLYLRKGPSGPYAASTCTFVSGSSYDCLFDYSLVTGGSVAPGDTIAYYVAAQDIVLNVAVNPAAGAAGLTADPPAAATPPSPPASYVISLSFSGVKTVCPSGCDYTNLTAAGGAFAALNSGVLTGNLDLQIAGNLVTGEDGSVALNPLSEEPSGSNFNLRIYPTGVPRSITSTTAPAGGFIRLNAADRITIDGSIGGTGTDRSLTITDTNTATTSAVIWMQSNGSDGAQNNVVKNLIVVGSGNTQTLIGIGMGATGTSSVSTSSLGTNNNNNTIQNNSIRATQYGIYSQGAGISTKNQGNVITQNVINTVSPNNVKRAGVLVGYENNIQITLNVIGEMSSSASAEDTFGIALGGTAITTSGFTGNEVTNATVARNRIDNIHQTATYSSCGIFVASATSGTNEIRNNAITQVSANATSGDFTCGILVGGGAGSSTKVYYNSVSLTGTQTGGSDKSYALAIGGSDPIVDVRNNVLYNTVNTGTGNNYAIGFGYATFVNLTSDYNDFFTAIGATYFVGATGSLSSPTSQSSLLSLQTATGKDAASLQVDPLFNSAATNLQPIPGSPLVGAGTPVSVTIDILGNTRSVTTPTIGAWEMAADSGGPVITYTNLANTTLTTNRALSITVTDAFSGVPTSGTGLPVIYYRKGTSGAYTANQCLFVSGSSYVCVIDNSLIGGVTTGNTVQYFVAAQDGVGNVSVQPSTGASGLTANPPAASVPPSTPSSYMIVAGIGGTKTVCASGCDFTTLTGAGGVFATINASVVTSNLSVEILGNLVVGEDGSNGLNAISEEPSGSNYTVRIYPTGAPRAISGSATGGLIRLNGADRVTIDGSIGGVGTTRNLSITNTNTGTTSAVVTFQSPTSLDGATNNTLKNTIITGNATTTTFAGVFMGGTTIGTTGNALTPNSFNTIANNQIGKAQYGIYVVGVSTSSLGLGLTIQGNAVGVTGAGNGMNISGIVVRFQDGALIDTNDVQNVNGSSATNMTGIHLQDSRNSTVSANRVHAMAYTGTSTTKMYPIYTTNSLFITSGNPSSNRFVNNAVYDMTSACTSATWCMSGMNNEGAYRDDYWFNSVSLAGVLTGSTAAGNSVAAFSIGTPSVSAASSSGGFDIRNNSFSVTGSSSGVITVFAHETTLPNYSTSTIDYNDLYVAATGSAASVVGRINSINQATLAAWQTATGKEASSISANPLYNSATNLAPQPGSPLVLAGTPVAVTIDIQGVTRNASTPTIGAFETAQDTVGPVISYTALGNTAATSNRTLTPSVADGSGVPTSGIGLPVIYFRKGSSGVFSSSSCSYVSGTNYNCLIDYSLVTGGSVMAGDTIQYYVVAQDNFGNVSAQPSTGAAGFTANPPAVSTPPTTPSSYAIVTAVAGSYNVGSSEPITSLTNPGGIFDVINNGVLTGNVTVNLTSNLTGETGAIALNQISEDGVGGYTLTIKPNGIARTIMGTGAGVNLIKLNGADRVVIDGSLVATDRSLTINNPSTASGSTTVWVASTGIGAGATNVTVKNCVIQGGTVGSSSVTTFGLFVGDTTGAVNGADNDNLTIQNNRIMKATIGMQAFGSPSGLNDNTMITGNTIGDAVVADSIGRIGLSVGQTTGASISGNTILNVVTTDPTITSFNNATGISLGTGFQASSVSGNNVSGVAYTGTAGYGGKGIDINTGVVAAPFEAPTVSPVTLANNFVSDIRGDGWSSLTSDSIVGIRIQGTTGGIRLYHNSVNLGSGAFAGNTSGTASAAFFAASTVTNLDLRNNIFATNLDNTNTASDKTYAVATTATTAALFVPINNNDYYVTTTPAGFVGLLNTVDRLTLGNWQTATGQDTASVAGNPKFVSATDLHITTPGPGAGEDVGTPLAAVTTDIDGDLRSVTTPDMGADEINRCAAVTCSMVGVCATDTCDPADGICKTAFLPPTTTCRVPAGLCDLAETCTGVSDTCPADAKSNATCRGAGGTCDVAEVCDGVNNDCPADVLVPLNTVCRASGGTCDLTEVCDGVNAGCPADSKSTAECRASGGVCDVADFCDGVNNACPFDAKSTGECRASAGDCDLAESCDGVNNGCPTDLKSTAECRAAAGVCDIAESCDGAGDNCPSDALEPATTECRPSLATCDPAEFCTGANTTCPPDVVNASQPVGPTVTVTHNPMTSVSTIVWLEFNPGPFNVYRGSTRIGTPWIYNQACLAQNVAGISTTDNVTPANNTAFFYLITRKEAFCNESSLGLDSNMNERPNINACPNFGNDFDLDGVIDVLDNCPMASNTGQLDSDGDGYGDVCDNCPVDYNPTQSDSDMDMIGDACE